MFSCIASVVSNSLESDAVAQLTEMKVGLTVVVVVLVVVKIIRSQSNHSGSINGDRIAVAQSTEMRCGTCALLFD